jgi:hypothetical protein
LPCTYPLRNRTPGPTTIVLVEDLNAGIAERIGPLEDHGECNDPSMVSAEERERWNRGTYRRGVGWIID